MLVNSAGPNTSYGGVNLYTPDPDSMSLSYIAVLALIAAGVGAFCATVKWLSLPTPFGRANRQYRR